MQVNCATLGEHLLESELFGHVRGRVHRRDQGQAGLLRAGRAAARCSSTRSARCAGRCRSKLLRVLQERTFERVGGDADDPVDARIIAATNRDLEHVVEEKRFREDLYYRLNVIELQVPALRDRPGEILKLARTLRGAGCPDA